jgi:hypothetical protein
LRKRKVKLTQEYEDSFTFFMPINVKLLINHLKTDYFKLNVFDSTLYSNNDAFIKKAKEDIIEKTLVKKDNIQAKQIEIFSKPEVNTKQLLQAIEEFYYAFLSKSIFLNNTVSYLDDGHNKNTYLVNIDTNEKTVDYKYSIYFKSSDETIKRTSTSAVADDKARAIIIKTASVETLLFFHKKVYGKERGISIRKGIYDTFKTKLETTTDVIILAFLYDNLSLFRRNEKKWCFTFV